MKTGVIIPEDDYNKRKSFWDTYPGRCLFTHPYVFTMTRFASIWNEDGSATIKMSLNLRKD